jgi:hypothetical protein
LEGPVRILDFLLRKVALREKRRNVINDFVILSRRLEQWITRNHKVILARVWHD